MFTQKGKIKPTNENLDKYSLEPVTKWLIAAAYERRTVTYDEVRKRLEDEIGFGRIFSTRMGRPAGVSMDAIYNIDDYAPLLNVLMVRQDDGMPGSGAASYLSDHFSVPELKQAGVRKSRPDLWRNYFEKAVDEVYGYRNWERIYEKLYGKPFETDPLTIRRRKGLDGQEKDGLSTLRSGEGANHRALRLKVKNNPSLLFPRLSVRSETEHVLLSGDRVDVVYFSEKTTIPIEVKSRDSNYYDLQRGVYQCIKYRAVMKALDPRCGSSIIACLVTETELPKDLEKLLRRFKIKHFKI